MKQYAPLLIGLALSAATTAQVTEQFSYQSVVRNGMNELVSNGPVSIRISILADSATGEVLYSETHSVESNANGLVSLNIGNGQVVEGDFSSVDWGSGPHFLKTETDPAGGSTYSIVGTSELLSVPYALHARHAGDAWSLTGNAGIDAGSQFIGTTDWAPLQFRVNGELAGSVSAESSNTSWGHLGLSNLSEGAFNVAVGKGALQSAESSSYNAGVGFEALRHATGMENTAVGYRSLGAGNEGDQNTAMGAEALLSNTASANTAVGFRALRQNTTGSGLVAVGTSALYLNTTGEFNTAAGQGALFNNTTGGSNTAVGNGALFSNVEGSENTALGYHALENSASAIQNTGIGVEALLYNTASANTAVGFRSLRQNTTGSGLVAVGTSALYLNSEGHHNTAIGQSALFNNTLGAHNTAIGNGALGSNSSGSHNIAIGSDADVMSEDLTHAVAIGAHAKVETSYAMALGGTGEDALNVGIGVSAPQRTLHVNAVMRLEPIPEAPSNPSAGDLYFDSTLSMLRVYDGNAWQDCW